MNDLLTSLENIVLVFHSFQLYFHSWKKLGNICEDKTYRDVASNRIFDVEDWPRKIELDRKTARDITFKASATDPLS